MNAESEGSKIKFLWHFVLLYNVYNKDTVQGQILNILYIYRSWM